MLNVTPALVQRCKAMYVQTNNDQTYLMYDLHNVLASTANPILAIIDEAIRHGHNNRKHTTFKDYVNSLILADCHNDLAELEAKVRALSPKGTIIKRKMKPYRDYVAQHTNTPTLNIRDLLV